MIDWNHYGKQDCKDNTFYKNAVSDESKQKNSRLGSFYNSVGLSSSTASWVVRHTVLCLVYFLVKLFS